MPVLRKVLDHTAQVVDESHVHHRVCFIEYEVVQVLQVDETLVHEVEQTPGSGDDDVDPAAEFLDLALLADAAKQRYGE